MTKEVGHKPICLCCGEDVHPADQVEGPPLPFCSQCVSGNCCRCRRWVRFEKFRRDSTFNLIGRPRGPRMTCGWGCGAELTGSQMRSHFTACPNRPLPNHEVQSR